MTKAKRNPPQLPPDAKLIDTHCHLDMTAYGLDLEAVVHAAADLGVARIIAIGIDWPSSAAAVEIAGRFPGVFAAVGIHPHQAAEAGDNDYARLAALAERPENKVVGYGEIGLDYAKNYAPRDLQVKEFARQLGLAQDLRLPVIIHDRDAHDDTMRLLREAAPFPAGGVMHCFSGDCKLARQVINLGFHISIPGIVTFKNAETLQQVAADIPLEHMLLETDGPFLAPVPWRGKRNKPEYLLYTAQKIADLRNISLTEVARRTSANARSLFRLGPAGATT